MSSLPVESSSARKENIQFTLQVVATDVPITSDQFQIRLRLDVGPDFENDFESKRIAGPNFHGKRYQEILHFISESVIEKVIEHIYFKDLAIDAEVTKIYEERRRFKQKGEPLANKENLAEEEKLIQAKVNRLLKDEKVHEKERNVNVIRYEKVNPEQLSYSVQTIVNGDMPPPRPKK
jgi:hypothetical protein